MTAKNATTTDGTSSEVAERCLSQTERLAFEKLLAAAKAALDALESQHEDSDETVLELRQAIQQAEGDSK